MRNPVFWTSVPHSTGSSGSMSLEWEILIVIPIVFVVILLAKATIEVVKDVRHD